MEIFLTGASGYIGLVVARAFRRAGHRVSGLARSSQAAETLMRHEIAPVLGSLEAPERYREAATRADVIVHAAIDYATDTASLDAQAVQALLGAAVESQRPKRFLYTSGAWVYGDTGPAAADETHPLRPPRAVAWRPAVEQLVLEAANVRGVVLRPGVVYGGRGGLTGMWFAGAAAGELSVVGDGANRWAMVHVEDLADAYVRVAEAEVAGEVFSLADETAATVGELARAAATAAGYHGAIGLTPRAVAEAQLGPLAEALALDQRLSSERARRVLGWRPRHIGFIAEALTYYAAWRAGAGQG
jgi:nucleoside-diphosphate-sugar epimerase